MEVVGYHQQIEFFDINPPQIKENVFTSHSLGLGASGGWAPHFMSTIWRAPARASPTLWHRQVLGLGNIRNATRLNGLVPRKPLTLATCCLYAAGGRASHLGWVRRSAITGCSGGRALRRPFATPLMFHKGSWFTWFFLSAGQLVAGR